jgi:ribose/xylose/arabinose/galactoside ABC-type transport system permease subunit
MTTTHSHRAHRRLDAASLALLLIGLAAGVFSYWLITYRGLNALIIVPSIVAITIGATHITKREASRP